FIMCMTQKFWQILLDIIERPDLTDDARFCDLAARNEHRDELTAVLDGVLAERDSADWLERMQGRIPAAPVLDVPAALDNPFAHAVGMVEDTPHPQRPSFRSLANPIRIDGERAPGAPGAGLGGDSDALLDELGYTTEEIETLRGEGVV
ncbi:MAG TPA: CoA transferase, partial [Pseudohaliea sp.]|nr:CoA transferase [Pseudohaliea sp.]